MSFMSASGTTEHLSHALKEDIKKTLSITVWQQGNWKVFLPSLGKRAFNTSQDSHTLLRHTINSVFYWYNFVSYLPQQFYTEQQVHMQIF